jgi:hypothetical protein
MDKMVLQEHLVRQDCRESPVPQAHPEHQVCPELLALRELPDPQVLLVLQVLAEAVDL